MESGKKGKEAIRSGPDPGGGLRGKERLHRWTPTLGSEQFEPHFGHPSPDVQHREESPLGWLECQWY